MKNRHMILILLGVFSILKSEAQDLFVKQARITYDKKIRPAKELGNDAPGGLGATLAGALNSTWSLSFSGGTSIYKSVPINDEFSIMRTAVNKNLKDELYFDFLRNTRVRKKVFGKEEWLLQDSIPGLEWKLLPEVREIAGYECRKALTRINDTVYVVAFYTDRILVKGGPEGFNGLPGMILGLAIPRYRTTWFASKVEFSPLDPKELQSPAGKKADADALAADIAKSAGTGYSSPRKGEDIKKELLGFVL